jgi:PAP2 superfamily
MSYLILYSSQNSTFMINKNKIILLFSVFFIIGNVYSQELDNQIIKINDNLNYEYTKPKTWDMFRYIPKDIVGLGKFAIQKENLKWDAVAVGSTLAILPYDQQIVASADKLGEKIGGGWNEDAHFDKIFNIFSIVPKNISSAVYYIGNGGTTLLLSGMFYGIGKIGKDDYRALNTSNELVEALISVGVVDQTIKRISGRESPNAATQSGGAWNPFPSFSEYQKHTPNYDAMPSGHMATYVAGMTIIATNYPEIKWIKPVGYTIGSILAFNMVSGKVHWTSDYPIAIFMGYVMGKNIAKRRIIKMENKIGFLPKKMNYKTNYSFNRYNNMNIAGVTITF